jgi:hypothetical protein
MLKLVLQLFVTCASWRHTIVGIALEFIAAWAVRQVWKISKARRRWVLNVKVAGVHVLNSATVNGVRSLNR